MKNKSSLIVSISKTSDLDKITKDTKYINIDITNISQEIISYFIKNGTSFMYSDIIENTPGYNYVSYNDFVKAENIIDKIYNEMPNNLNEIEVAKYLYVAIPKYVYFDINTDKIKNEIYNLSLMSTVNNIWGSLSSGRINDISASKIYYYLCRRVSIDISIVIDEDNKQVLTKLLIDNQVLITDLFEDIPFIQCNMQTNHFATYNDDISLDKKIKYLKNKYNNYYLDKALKNIDYTKEDCIYTILNITKDIININTIKPVELSIIYRYIFDRYCPNYNVKINNLYLNNENKNHFIIISYNNIHYSYNYKLQKFIKVSDEDIIDNINDGKIGLYHGEFISNINNYLNV